MLSFDLPLWHPRVPFPVEELPDFREQQRHQVRDFHALLFHRIAVAQCHGVFLLWIFIAEGIEVNRDSEGSPSFVLAPVPPSETPEITTRFSSML